MDEFQSALTTKCARLSEDLYGQGSRRLETEPANKYSPRLGLSDNSFIPDDNAGQGSHHHQSGSPRKAKVPKTEAIPGYLCFSLPGTSIKAPARGPYTPTRREQVGRIRKKGACLRCKIMKRAVSAFLIRHWTDADILCESSALGKIPVNRALTQRVPL
jgi:hypothetical protein